MPASSENQSEMYKRLKLKEIFFIHRNSQKFRVIHNLLLISAAEFVRKLLEVRTLWFAVKRPNHKLQPPNYKPVFHVFLS
jgi:hypothetical protein